MCPAEPPATCLRRETTIEALMECDRNAVIYTTQPGANATRAIWTALDGVVLDARFLFRGIILARDVDIRGVTIAQVLRYPGIVHQMSRARVPHSM